MTIFQKIIYYIFNQNKIVLAVSFGWAILSMLAQLETVVRAPNGRIIPAFILLGVMTFVLNIPLLLLMFRILERLIELIGRWRGYVILFIAFILEGVVYSGSKVPSSPVVGLFAGALAMVVLMAIALVFLKGRKPFISENLYSENAREVGSLGSMVSGMKPAIKWWGGAGGVAIVALVTIGYAYLQPSGFKGSVQELYEVGRKGQANFDNYEAWIAQDDGVEVLITNLGCNSDGEDALLLGMFSANGREEKACWKLDEKGVGIVSLAGRAKRIRPEAFKPQTVDGKPVATSSMSGGSGLADKGMPPAAVPTVANRGTPPTSDVGLSAKYEALHQEKSYSEWAKADMVAAVNLLANPVTRADRTWLEESERSTFSQECSTGSCLIHLEEFVAARKMRDGKAKSAQEALGLDNATASVVIPPAQLPETPKFSGALGTSQLVESLLNSARTDNLPRDIGEQAILRNLPKLERGDRIIAREKNSAGLSALNSGNYRAASVFFLEGVNTDRSDVEILNNLAYALLMDGQLEAAKVKLVEVLSVDVGRSGAWANLGDVFAKMGSQENAIASFKLTYYFSRAPEKTVDFYKRRSEADVDEKIRNASSKAVISFPSIHPMIANP